MRHSLTSILIPIDIKIKSENSPSSKRT